MSVFPVWTYITNGNLFCWLKQIYKVVFFCGNNQIYLLPTSVRCEEKMYCILSNRHHQQVIKFNLPSLYCTVSGTFVLLSAIHIVKDSVFSEKFIESFLTAYLCGQIGFFLKRKVITLIMINTFTTVYSSYKIGSEHKNFERWLHVAGCRKNVMAVWKKWWWKYCFWTHIKWKMREHYKLRRNKF